MACLLMTSVLFLACTLPAQVDPSGRSVLFIRGADGSGGLGSGSLQRRTEHLSDIRNTSTSNGNHGFGALAALLRANGFRVSQWIESNGTLDAQRLAPHRIVVFGSNNRVYSAAEVAAWSAWQKAGGSSLFVSDANWGSDWSAAARSDNQFLRLVDCSVYQDSADGVQRMRRSDTGRYALPQHPALSGPGGVGGNDDVDSFEGEGVSYFEVRSGSGLRQRVVSARGKQVRLQTQNGRPGAKRNAGPNDCALFSVSFGSSRIVGHFDRNTWFNRGGTGNDITRADNASLALRVFAWLASQPAERVRLPVGCSFSTTPALDSGLPILGRVMSWTLANADRGAALLLMAPTSQRTQPFRGCRIAPDLATSIALPLPAPNAQGVIAFNLTIPPDLKFSGARLFCQSLIARSNGSLFGAIDLSTGLDLRFGFPF